MLKRHIWLWITVLSVAVSAGLLPGTAAPACAEERSKAGASAVDILNKIKAARERAADKEAAPAVAPTPAQNDAPAKKAGASPEDIQAQIKAAREKAAKIAPQNVPAAQTPAAAVSPSVATPVKTPQDKTSPAETEDARQEEPEATPDAPSAEVTASPRLPVTPAPSSPTPGSPVPEPAEAANEDAPPEASPAKADEGTEPTVQPAKTATTVPPGQEAAEKAPSDAKAGEKEEKPSLAALSDARGDAGDTSDVFASAKKGFLKGRAVRSANLKPFPKWTGTLERYVASKKLEDAPCESSKFNQCHLAEWKKKLEELKGKDLRTKVEEINAYMNAAKYIADPKNYNEADYWATPIEFLNKNGDCEDYAIAKFISLRALDVPNEAMRIFVLQDLNLNVPHSVLVINVGNEALVLDNQIGRVTPANNIVHYKAIYSMNENAWWMHKN